MQNITREFLETRLANLEQKRAEALQLAAQHSTMGHTLHGAIQDCKHMLAVFDGKVPATGEVPTGHKVATDVTMDAEVNSGANKNEEVQ